MYDEVLGVAWGALPASIRATHQAGQSRGFMRVTWGKSILARWLARKLGFPPPSSKLSVLLEVQPAAGGLIWVRRMGSAVITTTQAISNGLVVEAFGSIVCAFRLLPKSLGFRYEQEYAALRWGRRQLQLPGWLSPRVFAAVTETSDGPLIEVEIAAPFVGRLLRYEGIMEPTRSDRLP